MGTLMKIAATKITLRKQHLSIRKQYKFMFRLKQLLERSYNLNDALEVIGWDKELAELARIVSISLLKGNMLATALHEAGFQRNVTKFLEIAAQYGNLPYGVKHCCYILNQQIGLVRRFKQLSTYPLLLFLFFIFIIYLLREFIFPSFQSLLVSEASTNSIFYTTSFIIDGIYYSILGVVVIAILLLLTYPHFNNNISIKQRIKITISLPYWKRYKRMQLTFLFTTHLASLMQSGLNIKECLKVLHESNIHPIITYYVELFDLHLNKGYEANSILPVFQLFEKDLQSIMQKDRNARQLTEELNLYSEHLLNMMEELLQKWLKILQPILLSILACLIVFVYLTMMLPMFDYIQTI
ncbi:type II secretion system F family protein [Gracilibacillus xinjiangensis]|uniref:Type II secretion system F family protein n=1 Tax=Gracilibacillus xinjiangensis TaxID=1193282 RepID=A0ABV8WXB2_9BACI